MNPETLINEIQSYVHDARALCEQGEYVALEGLDDRVNALCEGIATLDVKQAQQHAAALDMLMHNIVALQAMMEEKRAALGEEIQETTRHQQAAKAYASSDRKLQDT
jgi:hypothetical protein